MFFIFFVGLLRDCGDFILEGFFILAQDLEFGVFGCLLQDIFCVVFFCIGSFKVAGFNEYGVLGGFDVCLSFL